MRISPFHLVLLLFFLTSCGAGIQDGWERYDLRKNPPQGLSARAVTEVAEG